MPTTLLALALATPIFGLSLDVPVLASLELGGHQQIGSPRMALPSALSAPVRSLRTEHSCTQSAHAAWSAAGSGTIGISSRANVRRKQRYCAFGGSVWKTVS